MTLDTQRKPYSILMSEAERHHIAQQAAPLGISVPEFIRITALNKDLEKALLKIKKQQVDNKEAAQICFGARSRRQVCPWLALRPRHVRTLRDQSKR